MAREIAIPASIAGDLAVAASEAIERAQADGHDATARVLAEASEELIHAAHDAEGSQLVAVDSRLVQTATACNEMDGRPGSTAARAFLVNAGVWDER